MVTGITRHEISHMFLPERVLPGREMTASLFGLLLVVFLFFSLPSSSNAIGSSAASLVEWSEATSAPRAGIFGFLSPRPQSRGLESGKCFCRGASRPRRAG